jgi:predicted enzyme related to lactoylglutathione lyase
MNPVVHFELPADDYKRASDFYAKSFGWQNQNLGPDMGNYVTVGTTPSDSNGRPTTLGAINGGIYTRQAGSPAQHPSFVIAVENIPKSIQKIVENGGTIIGEPYEIPGVGQYVSFTDTEGNTIALLKPLPLTNA